MTEPSTMEIRSAIRGALEEYQGGATIDVIREDLIARGRASQCDRDRTTDVANKLAREGKLHRFGRRRRYVFQLPHFIEEV